MSVFEWINGICDPLSINDSDVSDTDEQVITLTARINNQPVAIYAQNSKINSGFMTVKSAQKICQLLHLALKNKFPVIAFLASPGISFNDQLASGQAYTAVIRRHIELQGKIPQIAFIMGPVLGAPAYSAVLMDIIIFSQYRSYLMVTGPAVVKSAIGETTSMAELGSAKMHSQITGMADFVLPNIKQQLSFGRILIKYIHNRFEPSQPMIGLPHLPNNANVPFDMHRLISAIVDASDYHEYKSNFGTSIICALARMDGQTIGIVANQSIQHSGAINCSAAQKAAAFIKICDQYYIPVVTLIDVPGFMPGTIEEQQGLLQYGAELCCALQTQGFRISLIIRRCYGAAAFLLMQNQSQKGQISLALETAHLGVMGQQSIRTFESTTGIIEPSLEYANELGLINEIIKPEQIREKLTYYIVQRSVQEESCETQ